MGGAGPRAASPDPDSEWSACVKRGPEETGGVGPVGLGDVLRGRCVSCPLLSVRISAARLSRRGFHAGRRWVNWFRRGRHPLAQRGAWSQGQVARCAQRFCDESVRQNTRPGSRGRSSLDARVPEGFQGPGRDQGKVQRLDGWRSLLQWELGFYCFCFHQQEITRSQRPKITGERKGGCELTRGPTNTTYTPFLGGAGTFSFTLW